MDKNFQPKRTSSTSSDKPEMDKFAEQFNQVVHVKIAARYSKNGNFLMVFYFFKKKI